MGLTAEQAAGLRALIADLPADKVQGQPTAAVLRARVREQCPGVATVALSRAANATAETTLTREQANQSERYVKTSTWCTLTKKQKDA